MKLALSLALAMVAATPVMAAAPKPAVAEPAIPFANRGGVEDWRVEPGETVVYLKDSRNQWYRVELMRPAIGLRSEQKLGIDAGPTDTLDKMGAIVVHGERYLFRTFERVDGPPKRG